jgi:pyruvate,orthophosphate dikinase
MIEVPRACLIADRIAKFADYFSFGTNDLTQMTFGYSRDDAAKFIRIYQNENILENDPFQVLDQNGVGELMKMAIEKGKKTNKNLKIGICGEHGGDSSSISFCHHIGLDYISCSPYRIPAARIASAKAALLSNAAMVSLDKK